MRAYQYVVLIIALTFAFGIAYSPHHEYDYPMHMDEWKHLEEAIKFNEQGFSEQANDIYFEMGFILFMSVLEKNFDLLVFYKY